MSFSSLLVSNSHHRTLHTSSLLPLLRRPGVDNQHKDVIAIDSEGRGAVPPRCYSIHDSAVVSQTAWSDKSRRAVVTHEQLSTDDALNCDCVAVVKPQLGASREAFACTRRTEQEDSAAASSGGEDEVEEEDEEGKRLG